jgi:hypothetical protein
MREEERGKAEGKKKMEEERIWSWTGVGEAMDTDRGRIRRCREIESPVPLSLF